MRCLKVLSLVCIIAMAEALDDLETAEQVIFRPLFVYKEKQEEREELKGLKWELEEEASSNWAPVPYYLAGRQGSQLHNPYGKQPLKGVWNAASWPANGPVQGQLPHPARILPLYY